MTGPVCGICSGRGYWANPSTHDDVRCGNCGGTGKAPPAPPAPRPVAEMTSGELRTLADQREREEQERCTSLLAPFGDAIIIRHLQGRGYDVTKRPTGAR